MKRALSSLVLVPMVVLGALTSVAKADTDPLAPPGQDPLVPMAQRPAGPGIEGPHALALRARWLTVPGWSLSPYTNQHTQLDAGWSVGLEYLYRRSGFDVVVSLDYSWANAADGNFQGGANDQIHYLHFDGLSSLSGDVSLVGHWNVLSWLEIRLGGGLGIGGVFGNIYQITNNSAGCATAGGDPTKCFPGNVGPLSPSDPTTVATLQGHACPGGDGTQDKPGSPCYRQTTTYPFNVRVVPVINTLLGVRFKAYRHVYIHLETGWRLVGFYLGGGPEFRF